MPRAVIIQARTSSRRLPGKVLREVNGKPLLSYLIERLKQCRQVSEVVVATSGLPDDDAVAAFCVRSGLRVFRGDLDDVMGRLLSAAQELRVDAFARVSGDSPLLDPALVDRGITEFDESGVDLVSNVFPRSFPKGQSVEVISVAALRRASKQTQDAYDREHVTPYIYKHPEMFRIRNFASAAPMPDIEMAVDTPDHLAQFERTTAKMTRPHWDYGLDELVTLQRR